jgi:hypothetical protein
MVSMTPALKRTRRALGNATLTLEGECEVRRRGIARTTPEAVVVIGTPAVGTISVSVIVVHPSRDKNSGDVEKLIGSALEEYILVQMGQSRDGQRSGRTPRGDGSAPNAP